MPVASLHWVSLGLYDAPLLVTEMILLDRVQVAQLRTVAEDDDHSVLDDGGSVTSAVYLPAQRTETLPSLGRLLVPDESLQVEAPELLADVARPHDPAVHEYLVVVNDGAVSVPLTGHSVLHCRTDEVPLAGLEVPPGQHAGERSAVQELSAHHPHAAAPHQGAVAAPPPLGAVGHEAVPLLAGLHCLPPAGLGPLAAVLAPPASLALADLQANVALAAPLLAAAPAVVRAGEDLTGRALHVVIALTQPRLSVTAAPPTAGLLVVVAGTAVH